MKENAITIKASINKPVETVWEKWTTPNDIQNWNFATDDWHCPKATNDLRVGGSFVSTMAAKDGSFSFDFSGTYTNVKNNEIIEYTIADGRKVKVMFEDNGNSTNIVSIFEPESVNPLEMQQGGWQAILNNFRKYVESIN